MSNQRSYFSSKKTRKARDREYFPSTLDVTGLHHQETAQICESSLDQVYRI